jgi:hypothetical protein
MRIGSLRCWPNPAPNGSSRSIASALVADTIAARISPSSRAIGRARSAR